MIPVRTATVPLLLILLACSPSQVLHSGRVEPASIVELCKNVADPVAFQGSGSVLFVTDGEKQSGSFDLRYGTGSSMAATFYSPMGTIMGSIKVHGDSGVVTLQEQSFQLPLDRPLDSLPLKWAGNLTLGAMVTAMSGRVASQFDPERLCEAPRNSRGLRKFVMENKTIGYTVISSNDLKKLKRITVSAGTLIPSKKTFTIIYESFFQARARYITIKVDDRNYFSLRYDKI